MKKIHLIVPMGGTGSRFTEQGYTVPKPLIKISSKPFFYWATQSVTKFIEVEDIIFVVLKEHIEHYKIDTEIKKFYPKAKIQIISKILNGSVFTCIEGTKKINDNLPILFNDCDHAFICHEFYNFCKKGNFDQTAGALLTFQSNNKNYSYVKIDKDGKIVETSEKKIISNKAICGAYYFQSKNLFINYAKKYLKENKDKESFMSGIYNFLIKQHIVKNFCINEHLSFGTPEEYSSINNMNYLELLE